MEYIIRGLTFALIPLIVSGILSFLRQKKQPKKGKVYLPKFFIIFGSICSVIFLIPTFICAFSDEPLWITIGFLLFSMLPASLIVAFINCRISYDEDGFTAKNFFGIKRHFTYDQITGIKENMHETYLYMGKHRIMIDEFAEGGWEFIVFAHWKHRKLHHNRLIPKIQNSKDIFNGNIESPGEFIFGFILMGIVGISVLIFTICFTFLPNSPNTSTEHQVVFQSFHTENNQLILQTTDGQIYKIKSADKLQKESITFVCDGKTTVTVYAKQYNSEENGVYHSVQALTSNGEDILTFEETSRLKRQENYPIFILGLIILSPLLAVILGTIIVGRNPIKYSPKTIKMFFKPEYVKNYSEIVRQYKLRKRK